MFHTSMYIEMYVKCTICVCTLHTQSTRAYPNEQNRLDAVCKRCMRYLKHLLLEKTDASLLMIVMMMVIFEMIVLEHDSASLA